MAKAKAKRNPDQQELPGQERPRIKKHPDLEAAANKYVKFRDQRMKAGEHEQEAYKDMAGLMEHYHLTEYELSDGSEIYGVPGEIKFKVRSNE